MVARARKPGESFKKYRANLKQEAFDEKIRLGGNMRHVSISFIFDSFRKLFFRQPTTTYNTLQNMQKRMRPSKAVRKQMRRARGKRHG